MTEETLSTLTQAVTRLGSIHTTLAAATTTSTAYYYSKPPVTFVVVTSYELVDVHTICHNQLFWFDLELDPYPDISGKGIIAAYLISAYAVVLFTIAVYFIGFLPPALLRPPDRLWTRRTDARASKRWQENFEKITLVFSDQQIITGIGILSACLAKIHHDLPVFHWRIATYLAWMSSTVHLATLSILRDGLRQSPVLLTVRLMGMLALLILLLCALMPMRFPDVGYTAVPTRCFWIVAPNNQIYFNVDLYSRTSINWVISVILLVVGYIWKFLDFWRGSRSFSQYWLRYCPEAFLVRLMTMSLPRESIFSYSRRLSFHVSSLAYVFLVAHYEFFTSFAASLWFLLIGIIWPTLQILKPLDSDGRRVSGTNTGNNDLEYGQIMALLLLAQPAYAVLETYFGERAHQFRHIVDDNVESYELLGHEGPEEASPVEPLANGGETCRTLSAWLLMQGLGSEQHVSYSQHSEATIRYLYSSRTFKGAFWLMHFSIVTGTVSSLVLTTGVEDNLWSLGGLSLAGYFGFIMLYLCIMSFFSKAFR